MSERRSVWSRLGRRKKAAGDDLLEPSRRRNRNHTAEDPAQTLGATNDSSPLTSLPHRPSPGQSQATGSAAPPPPAAVAFTELTAPTPSNPTAADPTWSAKRPQRLWDQAYDALKRDEPALVTAYERILSCQLQNGLGAQVLEAQSNEITQDDPDARRCQMKQLIKGGLDKTAREAKAKERIGVGMDGVLAVTNVVSLAIEAMPQASLVWAGVCVALEVSTRYFL
jgi:hypothetical protein